MYVRTYVSIAAADCSPHYSFACSASLNCDNLQTSGCILFPATIHSESSNTYTDAACLGAHGVLRTSCQSTPSALHQQSLRLPCRHCVGTSTAAGSGLPFCPLVCEIKGPERPISQLRSRHTCTQNSAITTVAAKSRLNRTAEYLGGV